MSTFARIVDGFALDCQTAATATELAARFHPEWLVRNPFVLVPDGTLHGAKDNGNGTFSNPISALPLPPSYRRQTRQDFRALVIKALGGNAAAAVKAQTYIDTAAANTGTANSDKAMRFALESFRQNNDFSRDDADDIMTALQFSGADKAGVLAIWPQV